MNHDLEIFREKLNKLSVNANERTLYPLICEFIQSCTSKYIGGPYVATSEESLSAEDKHIGFPDITVRRNNNRLVGWWEIKLPFDKLDKESFNEQFTKYKDSLENILFTNLREWQLWQWDTDSKPQLVDEIEFNVSSFGIGEEKKLENLLIKFFEGKPFEAKTPKQLALALARKTRLLSKQVEETYNEDDKDSDLVKLKSTFEKTLIQNISVHQFANMIAETLAYSLFLAFLEHIHRGNGAKITLQTAIEYLPTNVPVLKDLYDLINKVSSTIPVIYKASLALLEQLEASDIGRIYQKLVEHKPGEDPVIQFYEPFLKEYDPKEREARGVYYTPKPVVDYIVRSVDWILRNKFSKEKGLADESVQLLDPATGTGTFLLSAIQEIHENIKRENSPLGEEMVRREFNKVVLDHILKHFYGFELLIAPYAIAHLKLTLEIERLGFNFKLTKEDKEPDNDRFKVYLANTLDNPDQPPQDFLGFNSIPQESEHARLVKKDTPILAIVGNPPYSGISENPVEQTIIVSSKNGKSKKKKVKTWIGDLIEDYKYTEGDRNTGKHFGEKKHWLGDDYVKFIRFGHWKINKNGEGVLAFITNHSYLDNPTFKGMRYQLRDSFDEIYILNLHGNSKTEKVIPTGVKDENVFSIQQGVSISLFIKNKQRSESCKVFYSDLWGSRQYKFNELLSNNFSQTRWNEIIPIKPFYFFVPRNNDTLEEFQNYWNVSDIFPLNVTGIVTARDEFITDFNTRELLERIAEFVDPTHSDDEIRGKYFGNKKGGKYLPGDTRGWKLSEARKSVANLDHKQFIKSYLYRPFEIRSIYYSSKMVDWSREKLMKDILLGPNIGLVWTRPQSPNYEFSVLVSNTLIDQCLVGNKSAGGGISYIGPVYRYTDKNLVLFEQSYVSPNINSDFIKAITNKLSLNFIQEGEGDLTNTFGPESILYYIYAILYSPTYRERYSEHLKKDFPRIPITSNVDLFNRLIGYGKQLATLHLLGNNPFGEIKTVLQDSNNWGILPKSTEPGAVEQDWNIKDVRYDKNEHRIFINQHQFFEGVESEVWNFTVGGYQVCDRWLKDRKKDNNPLSTDEIKHYIKTCISIRETIKIMKEIDQAILSWPIK